jgi:nicotinate dehydrogenase subunit B
LKERVTFDDKHITSSSWDSYPIMTFPEVPHIEAVLLDRPELEPIGAGEAAQGPTAAAIANAIHDAVGVRVRDLPITPERIRAAVAAR